MPTETMPTETMPTETMLTEADFREAAAGRVPRRETGKAGWQQLLRHHNEMTTRLAELAGDALRIRGAGTHPEDDRADVIAEPRKLGIFLGPLSTVKACGLRAATIAGLDGRGWSWERLPLAVGEAGRLHDALPGVDPLRAALAEWVALIFGVANSEGSVVRTPFGLRARVTSITNGRVARALEAEPAAIYAEKDEVLYRLGREEAEAAFARDFGPWGKVEALPWDAASIHGRRKVLLVRGGTVRTRP